jgi:hypothetical protein
MNGMPPLLPMALRELRHSWASAAAMLLILAAAAALPVALRGLLRDGDARAERAAAARVEAVRDRLRAFERDLRGMTLRMGFNAVLLPPGQDPAALHANGGVPTGSMPAAVGAALAAQRPRTVNHLLPVLQRRCPWPERDGLEIVLCGADGEVFISDPRSQMPLQAAIAPGTCLLGRPLAELLGLAPGASLVFRGRSYRVAGVRPVRGSAEDRSLWLPLADAQELLAAPRAISAVYLLLCQCDDDGGAAARRELARLAPGHELVVFATLARARGEGLALAAVAASELREAEQAAQAAARAARVRLMLWLSAAGLLAAFAIAAALAAEQARRRLPEIAILRAVGWPASRVLALVLLRAVLLGLVAGPLALALGLGTAAMWSAGERALAPEPPLLAAGLLGPALLALLGSLPAAWWGTRRPPALALAEL